jgi:arylsulfatase A-like enzyme
VANVDFAPTLLDAAGAKAGRVMDGISLLPAARRPSRLPDRAIQLEALSRLLSGDFPLPLNGWDRPYRGVRTDRYTYVVFTETGEKELYDRREDPAQLVNVAGDPEFAKVQARLAQRLAKLNRCKGKACTSVTS